MNQKKVKMSLSKIKNLIQKLFSPDAWSVDTGILLLRMSCALMYLLSYLALFFTGPGKYSLDRFLFQKR